MNNQLNDRAVCFMTMLCETSDGEQKAMRSGRVPINAFGESVILNDAEHYLNSSL